MNNHQLINILKTASPFKYLAEKTIPTICEYGEFIQFENNHIVLTQGKLGYGLFILIEGQMDVSITLLGKGLISLATLWPGDFFGEINLLEHKPNTATIISKGKTLCFLLKKEIFDMLYIGFPDVRNAIVQAIIEHVIQRQHDMIEEITLLSANYHQKVIDLNFYTNKAPKTLKAYDMHLLPEFSAFTNLAKPFTVPNRYTIIEPNRLEQSCFFILNGAVKVGILTQTGLLKFSVSGSNTLFCSTSILNNQPELFIYKAISSATLLEITPENIHLLKQNNPLVWYTFYTKLTQYVVSLQRKLNGLLLRMNSENY